MVSERDAGINLTFGAAYRCIWMIAHCDKVGVSGTPVKDSQRTKTSPGDNENWLSFFRLPRGAEAHGRSVLNWYLAQHQRLNWDTKGTLAITVQYTVFLHFFVKRLFFCLISQR